MINFRCIFCVLCIATFSVCEVAAQSFEEMRERAISNFNKYKEQKKREFDEYRRKCNEEFAEYVRKKWQAFESKPEIPQPEEDEVPPVVIDEELPKPPSPKPLPFDEIIKIKLPDPQPVPITPIKELPQDDPIIEKEAAHRFTFFGTPVQVRLDKARLFRLPRTDENAIADAWIELSEPTYINLIHDCLKIRETYKLCDWGYLLMLQEMAASLCGPNTNETTLLTAFVYCQSGYKMRLAHQSGTLYMLYASNHVIYSKSYFEIDGTKYYILGENVQNICICEAEYPQETPMSLCLTRPQQLTWVETPLRTLQSKRYPDLQVQVSCNKNVIDFYNTYPTSEVNDNFMTRWAMYANTPFEDEITHTLYSQLRTLLAGLSQLEAVERLLNWTQTALTYEYDSKVWGKDRAFFPEETLTYPYADCEDRSILFTRMVRDLLGLKCILVYYPGHLASAVCFTENVQGDYISLQGEKYIICDPTYIGASVGRSMPNLNNQEVKVILLE